MHEANGVVYFTNQEFGSMVQKWGYKMVGAAKNKVIWQPDARALLGEARALNELGFPGNGKVERFEKQFKVMENQKAREGYRFCMVKVEYDKLVETIKERVTVM